MPEQGSRRQQGASMGDQTEAWKNERQMEAISQLFSAKRHAKANRFSQQPVYSERITYAYFF